MKIDDILRNDLVRDKILGKLSNVDCSNLMVAMRTTKNWNFFYRDKCAMDRELFCPFCMLNLEAPLLDRWEFYHPVTLWKAPINNIKYPHQFTLDGIIFQEQNSRQLDESTFILKESSNLENHRYRRSLRPNSSAQDINDYFKHINFTGLVKFSSEQGLLIHIEQVKKVFQVQILTSIYSVSLL